MCKHNQLNELVQYVNAYVELIIASKASSSSGTNAPVSIYPYIYRTTVLLVSHVRDIKWCQHATRKRNRLNDTMQ